MLQAWRYFPVEGVHGLLAWCGLVGLLLGLWCARRWVPRVLRFSPRCAGCGYALEGHAAEGEVRCPECGRVSVSAADRTSRAVGRRRRWALRGVGVVLVLAWPVGFVGWSIAREGWTWPIDHGPGRWVFPWKTVERLKQGEFEAWVGIDRRTGASVAEVRWRGRVVFSERGRETADGGGTWKLWGGMGRTDLAGNVFLAEDSVYQRYGDRRLVIIGPLASDGAGVMFDTRDVGPFRGYGDVDGDGRLELVVSDPDLDAAWGHGSNLWHTSTLYCSKGADGVWRFDPTKMRRPVSEEWFADRVRDLRVLFADPTERYTRPGGDAASGRLAALMIHLISWGHGGRAYALAEAEWPAGRAGKEKFLEDFGASLRASRYARFYESMEAGR